MSPYINCLKIILVTFNGGKPLNNIAFVPGNCEVINLENEEQFFRVWDSGFEEQSAGMCQDNSNPLGFTVLQEPTESKAFYGLTYRGKIFRCLTSDFYEHGFHTLAKFAFPREFILPIF